MEEFRPSETLVNVYRTAQPRLSEIRLNASLKLPHDYRIPPGSKTRRLHYRTQLLIAVRSENSMRHLGPPHEGVKCEVQLHALNLGTRWTWVVNYTHRSLYSREMSYGYEGGSVYTSQININRKECDFWTWKKKHLFLDISSTNTDTLVPSLYQCVETQVLWLLSQPFPHPRFNLFVISETSATQLWTALRNKHFPPWTGNISLWRSFALSPFAHKKTHSCTTLFVSTLLKHGRHSDYWNQSLNMRMRVCYLDYHEAGMCCYLVIHLENLWRPLQLSYFHLWPIYRLYYISHPHIRISVLTD
jgi:hypothetical protein